MQSRSHLAVNHSKDNRRHTQELDDELERFSFCKRSQIFEDTPGKSEMMQFGDFSGSRSEFGQSMSLERGMGVSPREKDLTFRSKSPLPPMSTLSSLSSRDETPRKTRSEGGNHSGSGHRFDPKSLKKVTALGMRESESDYSPSKFYQPARTPHGPSRLHQSGRKVSPKSFKDTATLFRDLGLEDSVVPGDTTTMPAGQSFRLPKDVPDLTALLASSRKASHKAINSVPVSEDNQKLFEALRELQLTVDALERDTIAGETRITALQKDLKAAQESLRLEQQRADLAEKELKQHLTSNSKSNANEAQLRSLESRNETLLKALDTAKKELDNKKLELDLAREEVSNVDEERNRSITRLANALDKIDELTAENEALQKQVDSLMSQLVAAKAKLQVPADGATDAQTTTRIRRQRRPSPQAEVKKVITTVVQENDEDVESDEAIEVSKSILNDSELDELTQEVQELRAKNAEKHAKSMPNRDAQPTKARLKQNATKKSRTVQVDTAPRKKAVPGSKHTGLTDKHSSRPAGKTQKHRLVLELSDSETSASDADVDDNEQSEVDDSSEEEDLHLFSSADDETTQILYRRKPSHGSKSGTAPRINVQKVINQLSHHEAAQCTICSRKAAVGKSKHSARAGRQASGTVSSKETVEDANATIRPSQPPIPALHAVLGGLEDEFRHLKLKYHSLTDEYHALDPSLGKRKRKTLASDLRTTIEALEGKADQIYAIFDVLEAAATGVSFDNDDDLHGDRPLDGNDEQFGNKPSTTTKREWIHT